MAESQGAHRQQLESAVVDGNLAAERRGQHYAFALGALAIVGGVILIALGKDVQGLVAILGALGTLAGVFIYGRHQQAAERKRKREETSQLSLPYETEQPN
jgi:uncharacterized membrane protein